jgi:hypothetical protein
MGEISMKSTELLESLETITRANLSFVEEYVQPLNDKQLHWNSQPESWNIIQVLAHLNVFSTYYQRVFEEKIKYTVHKQPVDVFYSSPLGRSAWKSVKLGNLKNIKRKLRAPKLYNPSISKHLILGTEIEDFVHFQKMLLEQLEAAYNVNLRRVKIPISLTPFIKLRLGDALMFHVYHNERHIEQINKLIHHPNFPK